MSYDTLEIIELPEDLRRYRLVRCKDRLIIQRIHDNKTVGERTPHGVWRAINYGRLRVVNQIRRWYTENVEASVSPHLQFYGR